jgi:hypothetical protein
MEGAMNAWQKQQRLREAVGPGAYHALLELWAEIPAVRLDEVRAIRARHIASSRVAAAFIAAAGARGELRRLP